MANESVAGAQENEYDVVIIGGGPAGLTAGIYSRRGMMKTVLLEKTAVGGQILSAPWIENYPGFPEGIASIELAGLMERQARKLGLEIVDEEVTSIQPGADGGRFRIRAGKWEYAAPGVIVATGASPERLGVPGEERLVGKGISYCAVCDAPLFRGRDVVVIGGGDSALEEALLISAFARRVTVVHRRRQLRASGILAERARRNPKIEFRFERKLVAVLGDDLVSGVKIEDPASGAAGETIPCAGVFIAVGTAPNAGPARDLVATDEKGYVVTDEKMASSRKGIFACGDVRKKPWKQVVVACAEGATAAIACRQYVEEARERGKGG